MTPLVEACGLRMSFDGFEVLKGVDLTIFPGEVHALIGENGAGKSTLAKIIAGVHHPTEGTLEIGGARVQLRNPREALDLGVALIHQEPLVFPDLEIAENIFAGHQPTGRGGIRWSEMRSSAAELLREVGADLRPEERAGALSVADQQMVELATALAHDARVLLMDEPTAALTPAEVEKLFQVVERLKGQGRGLVFVSHHLEEVMRIADRITVMRDGEKVAERVPSETTIDEIVRLMVGRELAAEEIPPSSARAVDPVLRVTHLTLGGQFEDVSFEVRPGEIVGLAGLVGAGRTEVCRALFGLDRPTSGAIEVNGRPARIGRPADALKVGLALVPEDRRQEGLLMPFGIAWNETLVRLPQLSTLGWVRGKEERQAALESLNQLRVVCRDADQPVRELSGGNQQKVVLGKWLMTQPRVLLLDEPTRGIDVGAKAEVHRLIRDLAGQGLAVVLVSSELPELLNLSDRVLVMREGKVAATLSRGQATEESVMRAATLGGSDSAAEVQAARANFGRIMALRESGILLLCVLLFLAAGLKEPRFFQPTSIEAILLWVPLLAIAGMGELFVIVSRGIDVSVGSMVGLSAMLAGMAFRASPHLPIAVGALTAVISGTLLGCFNGMLIARARIPPIIATLGTLSAFRGLIFIVSRGRQVDSDNLPAALDHLSSAGPFQIAGVTCPWVLVMALSLAGCCFLFARRVRTGRDLYAIGSNPDAAILRGLASRRATFLVYALSGAVCGLAGLVYASRYGFVNPGTAGYGLELLVIAAVVIGGANVMGGSGTVGGVLLGCLFLATLNQALSVLGIAENWQQLAYGVVILAALLMDVAITRVVRRAAS